MLNNRRTGRTWPLAGALILALAGSGRVFAQAESGSELQAMREEMHRLEQRVDQAERRAQNAESQATAMQSELKVSRARANARAGATAAQAQASADAEKGNPDFKNFKNIPVIEEKPFATLDINYFYGRAGWATTLRGGERFAGDGRNAAFVNPLVSDNNAGRLGNEFDTYIEPSFKVITSPFRDSPAEFGAQVTFSTYTNQRHSIDLSTNISTLDFFGYAKHILPFSPDAQAWIGRRGYLYQFYVNIIDRRSYVIGGDGGGFDNIAIGDFAKFDIAYLTASPQSASATDSSINPLNPAAGNFGGIRTQRGNLDKQSIYTSLHDIAIPGVPGTSSLHFQYQFSRGGREFFSGDYAGNPGGFVYNTFNRKSPTTTFNYADGESFAYTYTLNLPKLTSNIALQNKLFLGIGLGTAFDTTNADKLRNAPYYGVDAVTLANSAPKNGDGSVRSLFTLASAHAYKFADQLNVSIGKEIELEFFATYEHQDSGRPKGTPLYDPNLGNSNLTRSPLPTLGTLATTGFAGQQFAHGVTVVNDGKGGLGYGVRAPGTQDWFDVGVRPAYNFTRYFALVGEATYQYINNAAFNQIRRAAGFNAGAGQLFKLTIAPTLRYGTVGNYPITLRAFYSYAHWNNNLKGSLVAGDAYSSRNDGHVIGTQCELNF